MNEHQETTEQKASPQREPAVYRINRNEYWLAHSLESAISAAARATGMQPGDLVDELHPPYKLAWSDMYPTKLIIEGCHTDLLNQYEIAVASAKPLPLLIGTEP